ncbi:MAG: hypothetical protein P9L88_01125 [Candidatus Tantalella remota]|nr:hypothetical protein [Candidatus Tantalella remota]
MIIIQIGAVALLGVLIGLCYYFDRQAMILPASLTFIAIVAYTFALTVFLQP